MNDFFERPPYSILIKPKPAVASNDSCEDKSYSYYTYYYPLVIPPFFIVASHIRPTDALNELNSLDEAFNEAKLVFSTDLGMIMGDLNADCSYLSNANYDLLDLIIDTNFTWWIDKLADTTTSNSNCAYDRYNNNQFYCASCYKNVINASYSLLYNTLNPLVDPPNRNNPSKTDASLFKKEPKCSHSQILKHCLAFMSIYLGNNL